jgi:dsDNA-specific endonuclease/ATPase MutS2
MPGRTRERNHEALKALVVAFGPREASRRSGIPYGTISALCFRYKWRKAKVAPGVDVADELKAALEGLREESTVSLAQYVNKASKEAAKHAKPLEVARKVRDVAGVYSTLYPPEEKTDLIDGALLLGMAAPKDIPGKTDGIVREAVADSGPQGD